MKLFVVAISLAVAYGARLENTYLPPSSAGGAGGSGTFLATPFNQGSSSGFKSFSGGFKSGGGFGGSAGSFGGHSGSGSFGGHSAGAGFGGAAAGGFRQSAGSYNQGGFQGGYSGQQGGGRHINILKFNNENNGDGTYRFEYETENKISAHEAGQPKNVGGETPVVAQGGFNYISPEGENVQISYIADENGFQPSGSHLPTPPPIPDAILKSIQFNEASGTSGDDGSYRESSNSGAYQGDNSGSYSGGQSSFGGGYKSGGGSFGGGYKSGGASFGAKGGFGGSGFGGNSFGGSSSFKSSSFGSRGSFGSSNVAPNGGYRY